MTAGEDIEAGDALFLAGDGKVYRSSGQRPLTDEERRSIRTVAEWRQRCEDDARKAKEAKP